MRELSGLIMVLLIVAACNSSSKKGTYQLAKVKTEKQETNDSNSNSYNEMYLYIVGDNPNLDSLQSFCTRHKKDLKNAGLHTMVFFDKEEHAYFPESLTRGYTADSSREHIKAIYTYNTPYNQSRLDYYEDNALKSPVKSFDIP